MALAALAPPGQAQVADPDPAVLDPVVVTATRRAGRSFDAPAAVDRIDGATIRNGQPQVNLSESLVRVPGIVTLNRQNYAQDLQVSMRGFGARAAFGVRGVRLYQDDIPATMPDGQGQTGSFSLLSADSIEVLRGPASVLYGNAAGGVISLQTEEEAPPAHCHRRRRQLRRADAGAEGRRTCRRARLRPRRQPLRNHRLPRPFGGATQPGQRQAHARRRRRHADHAGRQPAGTAEDPGPAGPDACAVGGRPAPGGPGRGAIRHQQVHTPGTRRGEQRATAGTGDDPATHRLRRTACDTPESRASPAAPKPRPAASSISTGNSAASACG
ncbi:MAG: Plug domain-containing protein [Betaproteobacteria bacterium]|nr:Plug domain-containing protein [Betaproteobacteria bacterium]